MAPIRLRLRSTPVSSAGALHFSRLADPTTDLVGVVGAYPIDVDGDGISDLFVIRHGENEFLRGLGDCRFERANEEWGYDGTNTWSSAFSATWEAGSTWPTIAVGNYRDEASNPPADLCFKNQLFRRAADGHQFGAPFVLSPGWCALSMLFSSWDRSGRPDLRVSNDRNYFDQYSGGGEQLFRIEPGAAPRLYTKADGWNFLSVFGMGIASYDVTGDGYPDYYLTSQGDNKLEVLAGAPSSPTFDDQAYKMGVTATRPNAGDTNLPSTSWTPMFADVNNDGIVDLFVTKGNIEQQPDFAVQDPNALFIGQRDGTFTDQAQEAGLLSYVRGRGAVAVDLNADGALDLVVVNRRENVSIWRNVSGTAAGAQPLGNWVAVDVQQAGPNRDAIGSWLEVRANGRTMARELTIGGGQASGQLLPVHFGLGAANRADVRVTWPDGTVGPWQSVAANQTIEVSK